MGHLFKLFACLDAAMMGKFRLHLRTLLSAFGDDKGVLELTRCDNSAVSIVS